MVINILDLLISQMTLLKLTIFLGVFVAISVTSILLMILAILKGGVKTIVLDRYFADRFHVRSITLLLWLYPLTKMNLGIGETWSPISKV